MQSAPHVNFELRAEARSGFGKGNARKSRRAGKVPAVVYRAGQPATSVLLSEEELQAGLRLAKSYNVLVGVAGIRDQSVTCLIREIQRHPMTRAIEHVDLYEVQDGDMTTIDVPVSTTGRAAGVRAGGTLRLLVRTVKVKCSPMTMPQQIEIDVTNIDVNQFVTVSQLPTPAGSTVVYRNDFNVVAVEGKRLSKAEAAAEAAAAAAAAAKPAAKGAAKPAAAAAKPAAAAAAKPAAKK